MKIRLALLLASSLLLTLGCPATPEPGTDTLSINDTQATDTQPPGDIKQDIDPGDATGDVGPDSGESDVAVDTGEPKGVWEIRSLGDEGVVADMFAVTDGPTYAVGGTRVIAHMGGFWAAYGDPVDQPLHGVWADENVVVVVGEGGTIARRLAGSLDWIIDESPTTENLRAVYGRSADDIWAVGDKTTILHFDGTAWTQVYSGSTTALHALWIAPGSTENDGVHAVGSGGRMLRHSGDAWVSEQVAKSSVTLHAIWGDGDTLVAAGTSGTITMKTGGANWKGQASNDPSSSDIYDIAGSKLDGLVLVGAGGSIILRDGDKWNIQNVTGPNMLASDLVAAAPINGSWFAIGATGGGLTLTEDGNWVDASTQPDADVHGMTGTTDGKVWMVGDKGLIIVETSTGWTRFESGTTRDLYAAASSAEGDVWVAGSGGVVLHIDSEGTVSKVPTGVPVSLFGIAVSGDEVAVCGKGGTLMRLDADASKFTPVSSGTPNELRSCAFDSDGSLWLAGSFGTLIKIDSEGTSTLVPSEVGSNLHAVALGDDGVYVAGDNGVVIRINADGVTRMADYPGIFLYGLSAGGGAAFAAGWSGTILKREGESFVPEASGTSTVIEAIWHDTTRAVAAGRQGVMLVRTEAP